MATAAVSDLDVRVRGKDELSPTLSQIESRVIRWVGAISASLAAIKIGTAPIVAAAEFERELANIAKTTGFAESQIKQLSSALLDMSTRIDVSAIDLAKIAAAAGQQGLGKFGVQGVLQFTDSVSRMSSVLDITAEEAGENIGKVINIFKTPLSEIETAISTFNQVSNNSTAQGKELLDVVRRIGDAAGSLDLQGATALAATGLDFGQSPEVVGTAFANIFANLRAKAGEFGKLMNMSATGWISIVEKDGIGALKQVLDSFRSLDAQSQQVAITKLFGGGRISVLVNKLVQDTQNAVLTRNLESAMKGKEGTSAIREQETVLNTLVAQGQAAMNSLYKLGVEVTEQALGPLRQYVVELNKALQSDSLKSFLKAVVSSIMSMVGALVDAVKFVASLNVNWENFVRVAQVFIGLKIAQYFGATLANATSKFSQNLQLIAKGAQDVTTTTKAMGAATAAAAAQQTAYDATTKGAIASRILGYEDLFKKMKEYRAAQAAQALAEKEAAAAAVAAQQAKNVNAVAGGRATAANSQLSTAAQAAQAQRAALAAAEQQAAAAQAAQQQALNARLAQAAARDAQTRLQIEQAYQDRLRDIKATGTTVGLTALKREYANQTAQADAFHARSIAGIQSYYQRQAAAAAAGSAQVTAIERAALMSRLSALDGAINNQAAKSANVAGSLAQVAAANAALTQTTEKLTLAQKATQAASAAALSFGTIMRTVGSVVATAGRLIASGFFWVTILYSIGDALGLFDNLGTKLQGLTDKLGFTSQKTRELAIEKEKLKQKMDEEGRALDDLIAKYKDYTDAATGNLTSQGANAADAIIAKGRGAEDQSTKLQAIAELEEFQRSIDAQLARARQKVGSDNSARIEEEKAKIAKYSTEVAELIAKMNTPELTFDAMGFPTEKLVDYSAKIKELQTAIKAAEDRVKEFGDANGNLTTQIEGLSKASLEVGKRVASMFTAETLQYAQDHIVQYADLGVKIEEAQKRYVELQQAARGGGEAQKAAAELAEAALVNLRTEQAKAKAELTSFIDTQIAMPGVPDNVKASWEQLKLLIAGSAEAAKGVIAAATTAVAAGAIPTGTGANPNKKTATTGSGSYTGKKDKSGESAARKEAKARLDLERATIQAENNLKEEASRQQLARETDVFDRGLTAFRAYYQSRKQIQLQANQFDIDDKNREIKAIDDEIKNATDKAEKLKFQAQKVRLEGQIKVLELQKKSIDDENAEELRRAEESFGDRVREETNRLLESSIIPDDLQTAFKGNLDEMLAQYRVFIAQLRSEGKGALADSLTASFTAESISRTLQPIDTAMGNSFNAIARYQTRLGLAVTNGLLTSTQAAAAYNDTIKQQIAPLEQLLASQQKLLDNNSELATTAPLKYQAMQSAVDETRLRLQQLNAEQDAFAKEFNQQQTDSLSQILGQLELSRGGIVKALNDFVLSIAKNVQAALGKSLSETIMSSLNQTGSGGLGGFIQGVLQGGKGGSPAGVVGAVAGAKGVTLGSTPINALYVRSADAAGLLGDVGLGDDLDAKIAELTKKSAAPDVDEDMLSGVSKKLESALDGITDDLTGVFNDLSSTLTDLFSQLGDVLASAGGDGGWISLIASFFHSGGKVGKSGGQKRAVNPAIFANAPRYHEGTMPGLKGNEVAAVLQKGEQVLTEKQQADVAAQAAAGANGGGGTRIVNVLDPELARDYMESSAGEKIIMNHIRRNAALVSQTLQG